MCLPLEEGTCKFLTKQPQLAGKHCTNCGALVLTRAVCLAARLKALGVERIMAERNAKPWDN